MNLSIKREVFIYFGILITLAILMHQASLLDRFMLALENPSIFSHSLIYAGVVYLIFFVVRLIVRGAIGFFMRRRGD